MSITTHRRAAIPLHSEDRGECDGDTVRTTGRVEALSAA